MNYLAETIQKMSARQRVEFEKAVSGLTTIRESVDIAGKMVGKNFPFTELSETNRAELWNEDDPYFRIRFVQDGERWFEDEHGVWVDFPATDDELQRAAAVMGVHSLQELRECQVDGVVKCGSSLTLKDIIGSFHHIAIIFVWNKLAVIGNHAAHILQSKSGE